MTQIDRTRPHWSFWVISAVALIWNALGGMNYLMQMNPDVVAAMPETHQAIIDTRPFWATGGFALGVFGGAIGALLLLLRKSIAIHVFTASLIGIVLAQIHTSRVAFSGVSFTGFEWLMMLIMPLVVAVFLIWYTKDAQGKGWVV